MTQTQRELPASVRAAKLAGDTQALSELGRRGGQASAARRRAIAAELVRREANLAIAISEYDKAVIDRDAHVHHIRNLAGSCQD